MNDGLQEIAADLGLLEQQVMAEYLERAPTSDMSYLELPEPLARGFQQAIERIADRLYHSGDPRHLTLVTQQHDDLRIRAMYLRNLLNRDIPIPYLDHAHIDLEAGGAGPAEPRGAPPVPVRPVAVAPVRVEGLLRRILGALRGKGEIGQTSAPQKPQTLRAAAGDTPRPRLQLPPTLPEQAFHILVLHQLMEEDRLKLMKKGQELPRASERIPLPEELREAVVETMKDTEGIARSPEALRRKLAERARRNASLGWPTGGEEGPSRFVGRDRAETHFAVRTATGEKPAAPAQKKVDKDKGDWEDG